MTLTYAFAPIFKRETTQDGHLILHGKATGPDLDLDSQICDADWLKSAMPKWFQSGANIREMHQAKAVGKGVELEAVGDDWMLTSKIVDRDAVEKCDEEIYTGYSIGIKNARVIKDASAPNGRITAGEIIEVSIVDRPANPTAKLVAVKAAVGDDIELVDDADLAKDAEPDVAAEVVSEPVVEVEVEQPAEPEAPARPSLRSLVENARQLGPDAILEHLRTTKAAEGDEFTHDPAMLAQTRDNIIALIKAELDELMAGEDELWDVSDLLSLLAMFLCWWEKEAAEGETTSPIAEDDDEPQATTVTLAAEPDTTKAEEADTPKIHPLDPAEVERMTADAVTKATQPLEAALSELRGQLAEVMKMAAPGGPSRLPTQLQKATATRFDHLRSEHARYSHMADTVTDPVLRQGYRDAAKALEPEIAKLTN